MLKALRSVIAAFFISVIAGMSNAASVVQINPFDVITQAINYSIKIDGKDTLPGRMLVTPKQFSFNLPIDGRAPIAVSVDPVKFMQVTAHAFHMYTLNSGKVCDMLEYSIAVCAGQRPLTGPDNLLWLGWEQFASGHNGGCYLGDYAFNKVQINDNSQCNVFENVPSGGFDAVTTGWWIPSIGSSSFFYDPTYHPDRYKLADWYSEIPLFIYKAMVHFGDGEGNGDGPPSATTLEKKLGFAFGETVTGDWVDADHPAGGGSGGTGGTPGGTPGTGSTCTTSSGSTSTNQYDCAPKDTETSCSILDIPCNLKKLFVPAPDYFKKTLNNVSLSEKLHLPIRSVDHWDIQVKFMGTDIQTIPLVFDDFFTEDARKMLLYLERICIFFWVLNTLGLPNPFGRSVGGADAAIRAGAQQYRHMRSLSGDVGDAGHVL